MFGIKTTPFLIVLFISHQYVKAQEVNIEGKVNSTSDVENIHVINKSKQLFAVTNKLGEFSILVSQGDTIQFSSIQHKPLEIIISSLNVNSGHLYVELQEQINELDEVIVGKVLTGNLALDIQNMEGKPPISFYDLGIPGYTGKIATQSERRLSEAGIFKPKMLLGLLEGGLPLNPILNGLSGRTKQLRERVEIEAKEDLLQKIRSRVEKDFLMSNPLEDSQVNDFFYFCSEDENFIKNCNNKTDFQILIFLRQKYRQYQENLKQEN